MSLIRSPSVWNTVFRLVGAGALEVEGLLLPVSTSATMLVILTGDPLMCDDLVHPGLVDDHRLTRRTFGLLVAATAGTTAIAADPGAKPVSERDVAVKTADGTADAALFYPNVKGRWPAILVWPDIMGLRPAFRELGRRLAAQGYVVLVPNPFYRSRKAPVLQGPIDFGDPETRKLLMGYRATLTPEGILNDAKAHLAFLDEQKQTDIRRAAGVQGYCMGGELSFRTAAAVPNRIAAVGSFHGGNGLVTDKPDSPHLLIARTQATYLVAHAQNDDAQNPHMKDALKAAFMAAGRLATVEVYPANHGWCVPGGQTYDVAQAERAWAKLMQLYRVSLA
jgi:carboxymethylenebutenolidase